jgi:AcrR family transcriptional regulator
MPKDTFNNLSQEKKKKIFDAAVREFSTKRFSESSINQIVKLARIPRGSFYQYFNDKEDVYFYMFKQLIEKKHFAMDNSENIDLDADIFKICIQSMKATYELAQNNPEYIKIMIYMEIDDSTFIKRLRESLIERFMKLIQRDKERGFINPETDSNLVADMIYTLIWKQASLFLSDEKMFIKKFNNGIKIIKEGIGRY